MNCVHVQQGYMLALTGHSLGGAVAGLLAMIIHSSAWSWFFKTSLGILPSHITCWGFGCAPCVDRRLAQTTKYYIRNVVLQVNNIIPWFLYLAFVHVKISILGKSWKQTLFKQLHMQTELRFNEKFQFSRFEDFHCTHLYCIVSFDWVCTQRILLSNNWIAAALLIS